MDLFEDSGWELLDYCIIEDATSVDSFWANQSPPREIDALVSTEKRCKRGRGKDEHCAGRAEIKACREKMRREKMNDRFLDLSSVLEPGRPPKTDKSAILSDAIHVLNKLRSEAQDLKGKNQKLREDVRTLKVNLTSCGCSDKHEKLFTETKIYIVKVIVGKDGFVVNGMAHVIQFLTDMGHYETLDAYSTIFFWNKVLPSLSSNQDSPVFHCVRTYTLHEATPTRGSSHHFVRLPLTRLSMNPAEKNGLREEKLILKADKEKMQERVKAMNVVVAQGYVSAHPLTYQAAGANKMVGFPSYGGFQMWQWIPQTVLDTSQDHVLRPPVA